MSSSSRIPSWAFLTVGDSVWTTIPSATGIVHEVPSATPRGPSTSMRHIRHMPTGFMRGCQQKWGM
jgi:hypothetical protein